MATDDGGAAYPHGEYCRNNEDGTVTDFYEGRPGMTLLDHFAGIAWEKLLEVDLQKDYDDRDAPEVLSRKAYREARPMVEEKRRIEKEDTP